MKEEDVLLTAIGWVVFIVAGVLLWTVPLLVLAAMIFAVMSFFAWIAGMVVVDLWEKRKKGKLSNN